MFGRTQTLGWALAALCAAGCGPGAPSLDGTWSDQGDDFFMTLSLQGPPDALKGSGSTESISANSTFTVSGNHNQLVWTVPDGGSTTFAVFVLDPNSFYLELRYDVPATGTCSTVIFNYDQCTGVCLSADAGGSPAGFCFVRD